MSYFDTLLTAIKGETQKTNSNIRLQKFMLTINRKAVILQNIIRMEKDLNHRANIYKLTLCKKITDLLWCIEQYEKHFSLGKRTSVDRDFSSLNLVRIAKIELVKQYIFQERLVEKHLNKYFTTYGKPIKNDTHFIEYLIKCLPTSTFTNYQHIIIADIFDFGFEVRTFHCNKKNNHRKKYDFTGTYHEFANWYFTCKNNKDYSCQERFFFNDFADKHSIELRKLALLKYPSLIDYIRPYSIICTHREWFSKNDWVQISNLTKNKFTYTKLNSLIKLQKK